MQQRCTTINITACLSQITRTVWHLHASETEAQILCTQPSTGQRPVSRSASSVFNDTKDTEGSPSPVLRREHILTSRLKMMQRGVVPLLLALLSQLCGQRVNGDILGDGAAA